MPLVEAGTVLTAVCVCFFPYVCMFVNRVTKGVGFCEIYGIVYC